MNQNDNRPHEVRQGMEAKATAFASFIYGVNHQVGDLMRISELLRDRGIMMLPWPSGAIADASAWESPNECVAVRGVGKGEMNARTVMFPGEYTSIEEYTDALARAILNEPDQCMADGCTNSEDDSASGYCSAACFAASEPEEEEDGDDASVETAFLENIRTTWTVHLTNGLLTGYPSWQRAVHVARQFNRPMVLRISGPKGTVPLVGQSLAHALDGGVSQ